MNKRLRSLVSGACMTIFLALIGCASIKRMPVADEVVGQEEEADVESLRRGRTLAVIECSTCHRNYWPEEFSPNQWSDIAQNMGRRANLTGPQTQDLRAYLMAAARSEATRN